MRTEHQERQRREREAREAKVARLIHNARHAQQWGFREPSDEDARIAERVHSLGYADAIDIRVEGAHCFWVEPRYWQAYVFERWVLQPLNSPNNDS